MPPNAAPSTSDEVTQPTMFSSVPGPPSAVGSLRKGMAPEITPVSKPGHSAPIVATSTTPLMFFFLSLAWPGWPAA